MPLVLVDGSQMQAQSGARHSDASRRDHLHGVDLWNMQQMPFYLLKPKC